LGILSRAAALQAAEDAGLDLVEISPNAEPPVAKIIDWGKYQYQKMKEQQRNKRSSHAGGDLKQMKIGLKIGQNDLDIKFRKIRSFLADGDKVKILVIFRGREMAHQEIGMDLMNKIIGTLGDEVIVESTPQMSGRNLSATVRSNNNAKTKNS
jgi:translation initiation factor IF-3